MRLLLEEGGTETRQPITQYCCGPLFPKVCAVAHSCVCIVCGPTWRQDLSNSLLMDDAQIQPTQWQRSQLFGAVRSETVSVEPRQNFLVFDIKLGQAAFRTAPAPKARLVMGPVVGAVTETTAVVVAETNKTQQLTCTLVNQLTNVCDMRMADGHFID